MQSGTKNTFRKIFKIIAWVSLSLLMLLITVALLIQVPAIQTWITKKAVTYLETKIGTKVALGGVSIGFPKSIILNDIYLEDQTGDTLLYAAQLAVDTDLWALTQNEIQLNKVDLQTVVANVNRQDDDSTFNFTYILEAFAGDSTAVPDTLEQKSWNITLETLRLENIRARLDDRLLGNNLSADLGLFEVNMNTFDLENNLFAVDDIILADSRASFTQSKAVATTPETGQATDSVASLVFSLDELLIRNVDLRYKQTILGEDIRVNFGELSVLANKIDLLNQDIALERITLKESLFAVHTSRSDTGQPESVPDSVDSELARPWRITLEKLSLENNRIEQFDLTQPKTPHVLNPNHLLITQLNIDGEAIRYDGENIQANLSNLSFREQSGFEVTSLEGIIRVTEEKASLNEVLLTTRNSRLKLQAEAVYPSFRNIGQTWRSAELTSTMSTRINVSDMLYFNPTLLDSLPLELSPDTEIQLDAAILGRVNNLKIQRLNFRSLSDTHLNMSGKIIGLPETENLMLDLRVDNFHTTRSDIETILPDTLLPDSLQIPTLVELNARYQGKINKGDFASRLVLDDGSIEARGDLNLDSTSATRGMNVSLRVDNLPVGSILGKPDSVMGRLAMQAELKTRGIILNEMNSDLQATVDHFDLNGYRYEDLQLEGKIRDGVASITATMEDDNLDFKIDGAYMFGEQVPRYDLTFDLRKADFRALNLSTSPIRARGTLMADLATSDFKVVNGNIGVRKVAVFNGDELYAVDSLLFVSIDQKGRSEIAIDSDLLTARFEGSINLFGLPSVMREYFHSYFALHDSLEVKDAPPQHFSFEVELRNTELLTELLVPDLTTFDPGPIRGSFDSNAKDLAINMNIDAIQYGNIGISSFAFTTRSNANVLDVNLTIDKVLIDSMRIDGLQLLGHVRDNRISTDLIVLDSAGREKYVLGGSLFSLEKGFEVKLPSEGIVLNYENWSVPADNNMRFAGETFVAHNVQLAHEHQKIIIQAEGSPGTPISLGFRELNLEYLTSVIAEERPASGLLNGDIDLFSTEAGLTFTSDLSVDGFKIKDVPWGDIAIHVSQQVKNRFDVNAGLTGDRNNISIKGYYQGGEFSSLDLVSEFKSFDLESLRPLLATQVSDLSGILQGQLRIKGTPLRPDIDGSLLLRNTAFFSNFLNTGFSIDEESITFVDEGISFNTFEISDQSHNKLRLDGLILTKDYRDFQFRMDLSAQNFRLLNTSEGDNDLFYGKIDLQADAKIRGNTTTPIIDLDIGLSKGSNLTYIVPQSEASVLQAEGIVKFVDRSFEGDPFMQRASGELADTVKTTFRGIDLTARIELNDEETFTIVIDPLTQDQLSIKGNSTLTLQMDPTGDMNLTGRLEITEGTYNLSFYKFVKREFQIEQGSSITWLGDPLNAQMDIRAIFNIETSPIELFSNQLIGADPNEVNQYKQRMPFMVYLNLTGELLKPEVSFRLDMPADDRNAMGGNVYARLQDVNSRESDLNKQVFALLILKRFISDDPFQNQAAGGFASTARNSVSKILSEQLNRLSENIKGVELSFDIKSYEDYTSGQAEGQTELELGVSKSLFNNRLVVKLAGNIDIEGQNANRNATDYIGDLALEYKITPDGRFRIVGFRNSNYDMIDGELIETGAGFIYVKDYNALSELFKANAETKN